MNSIKVEYKMGTKFMNSENSKTFEPYRLLLNLSDKINLKRSNKYVALSNLSIYYTWEKNIKKSYKNNQFKISGQTWNEKFELTVGLYSVSDIQDYFEYIMKKHDTFTDNPPTFRIKKGYYYLELLTPETMKLLGSTKSKITKYENSENVPHLEITY